MRPAPAAPLMRCSGASPVLSIALLICPSILRSRVRGLAPFAPFRIDLGPVGLLSVSSSYPVNAARGFTYTAPSCKPSVPSLIVASCVAGSVIVVELSACGKDARVLFAPLLCCVCDIGLPFSCAFTKSTCSKSHRANSTALGSSELRLRRSFASSDAICSCVLPFTSIRIMYSESAESSRAPVLHPISTSLGCTALCKASASGVPAVTSTAMMRCERFLREFWGTQGLFRRAYPTKYNGSVRTNCPWLCVRCFLLEGSRPFVRKLMRMIVTWR